MKIKRIRVRAKSGKVYNRTIRTQSREIVKRHRGTAFAQGLVTGLGSSAGAYAAGLRGHHVLGAAGGAAISGVAMLASKRSKSLAADTTRDARSGGDASVDLGAYRGHGLIVGGLVGHFGARLAHGLYNKYGR